MTEVFQPRDIEITSLPNGVRVATESMPHVRSVSVGVWIEAGSRCEGSGENGISHFIEHLLFKGTETRSAEDIARSVDSIGGNLDAFTSKELVCFSTKVLDEHLPKAFDILSDLILHPLFREDDLEKEKGVILEEVKMEEDSPDYLVHEIFTSNFWRDHPLGKPILGTKDSIRGFRRESVETFYRRWYAGANTVITAAGHLSHDALVNLAADRFTTLPAGPVLAESRKPATHARIILRNKKALEQVHLCLGVPSYPLAHERRFACHVLNTILGGGMSSRLFQNIRERQGLAYSVFSELSPYRDTGCLSIYAGTSLESARRVVQSVLQEFRSLKQDTVPAEELRRAKDYMKGSLVLGMESTSSRMASLARQELYFRRFVTLDELLDSIESVTAGEVQDIACRFFDQKLIALTALGSLDGFHIGRDDLAC